MKVIIAGSRDTSPHDPLDLLAAALDACDWWELITEVVSGRARGIDKAGEWYAKNWDKKLAMFPADWKQHGRAAGPIRNAQMAEYADALLAIWDGKSRGTKNMIDEATKRGLRVFVYLTSQFVPPGVR